MSKTVLAGFSEDFPEINRRLWHGSQLIKQDCRCSCLLGRDRSATLARQGYGLVSFTTFPKTLLTNHAGFYNTGWFGGSIRKLVPACAKTD